MAGVGIVATRRPKTRGKLRSRNGRQRNPEGESCDSLDRTPLPGGGALVAAGPVQRG